LLTIEQSKVILYDLINSWVSSSGSDKSSHYDTWVTRKFPKKDASYAYTARLLLSISKFEESSQEMRLLARIVNEKLISKDIATLMIKLGQFISVQKRLPKIGVKNYDQIFVSRQDMIAISEKFFPGNATMSSEINDFVKSENLRCKKLRRTDKQASLFLEKCLKVDEISVPYLSEFLLGKILYEKVTEAMKIRQKNERIESKIKELGQSRKCSDFPCEDVMVMNNKGKITPHNCDIDLTRRVLNENMNLVEDQKFAMINQIGQLRKAMNMRRSAVGKMVGLVKAMDENTRRVKRQVAEMRQVCITSRKTYLQEEDKRALYKQIKYEGVSFLESGSNLPKEGYKEFTELTKSRLRDDWLKLKFTGDNFSNTVHKRLGANNRNIQDDPKLFQRHQKIGNSKDETSLANYQE
jgi:hypothetical protein